MSSFDSLSGKEQAIVCILVVLIVLPFIAGLVWLQGWVAITCINYLAQSPVLPATHPGYFAAGGLVATLQAIFKRGSSSK